MARQFFVGGNFKMNPVAPKDAKALVENLVKADIDPKTEVVIAPPTIYLSAARETVANSSISIAAQNCYIVGSGAFTGEISPHMLAASSIPWVIIGHSERRTLFDDTSALVAKKTAAAIAEKIKVILCIGETLEQREADKTMDVCKEQLDAVVEAVKEEDWKSIVVAYEPVWAIGTGKVATSAQAQEVHEQIRAYLSSKVSQAVADETRIIYGGSVAAKNCVELAGQKDIDGFLVGGASLKPEFTEICNSHASK